MTAQTLEDPRDPVANPIEDPCSYANIKVTYNNQNIPVINKDCPSNSMIDILFTIDDTWACGNGCSYDYKILSNATEIKLGHIPAGQNKISISINPSDIVRYATASETVLTVQVFKICYGFMTYTRTLVVNEKFGIQTVNNGQEYSKKIFKGFDEERICIAAPNVPRVCCKPGKKEIVKIKNINLTEAGGEIKFSGEVELKNAVGSTPFNVLLRLTSSVSAIWKVSKSFEQELVYEVTGKANACVYMGISIEYNVYDVEYYVADCDQNSSNDVKLNKKEIFYEFYSKEPAPCELEPLAGCKPPKPIFNQNKYRSTTSDCSGSIYIEEFDEGIVAEDLSIEWKHVSGALYNGQSLSNVPYGNYKVTITNECCEAFIYEVFLCPNENKVTSWIYDIASNRWCADFSCDEPSEKRSACVIKKCVEADRIEPLFENGKCIEKHYYKGEELGITGISDPDIKIEYDGSSRLCQKMYLCGSQIVMSESQAASYGGWTYNLSNNKCERLVFCFNEVVQGTLDIESPETVYQKEINQCIPKCDGIQQQSYYPVNPGYWTWDIINGCQKTVVCNYEDGSFTVTGNESFPYWTYNQQLEQCESPVYCDYEQVSGVINNVVPSSYGPWQSSTAYPCYRVIYCGAYYTQVNYDYGDATYIPSSIPCDNSPGFLHYIVCDGTVTSNTVCPGGEPESRNIQSIMAYVHPKTTTIHVLGLDTHKTYLFSIFNIHGQRMSEGHITSESSISTHNCLSGVYSIIIYDNNKNPIHTQKIILSN